MNANTKHTPHPFGPTATILRADFNKAIAERDVLRTENARLREALEGLLDNYVSERDRLPYVKQARAALAGKGAE